MAGALVRSRSACPAGAVGKGRTLRRHLCRSTQIDPAPTEDVECVGVGMEVVCEVKPHVPTAAEREAAAAAITAAPDEALQQQAASSSGSNSEEPGELLLTRKHSVPLRLRAASQLCPHILAFN